jgi:predicted aspartyl protease
MKIIKEIEIGDKKAIALFDTGATHNYVKRSLVKADTPKIVIPRPYKVALGGKKIEVRELYLLLGKIEGWELDIEAVLVDDLGKVDTKEIDAIIGVLTMEKWEIIPNPKDGTLDLTGLKRREFVEF